MRKIVFRAEAAADLQFIIDYYEEVAPASVGNILSDIHRSIDQLANFAHLGMPVPERTYRRMVTLKYHFKIAYEVKAERIVVLGIFRYQDREK